MKYNLALLTILTLPLFAQAGDTVITFANNATAFVGITIVGFLYALALFFFVFNVVRYFIIGGGNEQEREKAKLMAIYGIFALVIITALWGIVNLLLVSFGLTRTIEVNPDYGSGWQLPCPEYTEIAGYEGPC